VWSNPTLLGDVSPQAAAEALRESLPGWLTTSLPATAEALRIGCDRQAFNPTRSADLSRISARYGRHVTECWQRHNAAHAAEAERRAQYYGKECEGAASTNPFKTTAAKKHSEEIEANIGESPG